MEVAGSAVGIASLGIQICHGLLNYYDGWKDYEPDIASARESIVDLSETLVLLKDSLEQGGLEAKRAERVKSCLESCRSGVRELEKKRVELYKHDKTGGWQQKARWEMQKLTYPFRKDTLAKLRGNVADVRERLKLALQVLQLSMQQSDRFRSIVSWLAAPDPWTNHHSARQRFEPDTGAWLLQSQQFQRWKTGDIQHLWLSGKAGCGKTVLCSTMIEDVQAHCEAGDNLGLAVFYFTFSDKQKHTYADMLRSLVSQLAWKQPALSMLQKVYDSPNRSVPGVPELEAILLSSLRSYDDAFIALDALDESPEDEGAREIMLQGIQRLTENAPNFKLLATSRELRDVRESMADMKAESLSVATSAVNADIRKYVTEELSRNRRLSGLKQETKVLIEDTLSAKADGMFRWAYCQLHELSKLKSPKPKYVQTILDNLPATLDETYERMLGAIDEIYCTEALTLLQWLAYSERPLTLAELVEAAIIDPDAVTGEQVDVEERGELEDVFNILSGLVTIIASDDYGDDHYGRTYVPGNAMQADAVDASSSSGQNQHVDATTKIRLAHFSVKEYLESDRIRHGKASYFSSESHRGHRFLTHSCLAYLEFYSDDEGKSLSEADLTVYPLLQYAARSWYYHSPLQGDSDDLEREVAFMASDIRRRDWTAVAQPHNTSQKPFETAYYGSREYNAHSLYYAALLCLDKLVEALLAAGADVQAQGGLYGNALQAASIGGYEKVVRMLLDAGADVKAQGGRYGNALQAASIGGYEKVVRMLLDAGADVKAQGGTYGNALQAASSRGYEKVVRMLLDAGADVKAQGGYYGNAVQAASSGGYEKVVRILLDAGADVKAQGGRYGNAVQAASSGGYEKVVRMLLDARADVKAQGGRYGNALQAASEGGYEKVVRMLLNAGADVKAQGGIYGNALLAASERGSEKVVRMLLDAGADVKAQGGTYGNALQAASEGGYEKIVQMLLDAGADVKAQGGHYGNALQAASERGSEKVVRILLDAGADVKAQGGIYGNALQAASIGGYEKVVRMLLDAGADVNAQTEDGLYRNALEAATEQGHKEIVQILLDAGAVEVDAYEPGEDSDGSKGEAADFQLDSEDESLSSTLQAMPIGNIG